MKSHTTRAMQKIKENRGFLLFVLLLFTIRWSFADHYRVPTGSMLPTIQIGDHLLVNKMAYNLKFPFTDWIVAQTGGPKRGDIVVFKYPQDPSINMVKRLIGVPGDEIEILDGLVKVNGELTLVVDQEMPKNLEQLYNGTKEFAYQENLGEHTYQVQRIPELFRGQRMSFRVPDGNYFFMGDNRDNSSDGRSWGLVPRDHLKGKATHVTFSVDFENVLPDVKLARFGKKLD